ncbi:putative nuclease HARBI1 isoform X2 [Anoplophora glabripennis]|uniref:putative nuclease HARBI1 isoform X2 n=1 Tax=Anoplophora glabripennis TaxID=217634 RepID=UPI000874C27F|nr:putative nuclease HARBI1 isoform X2 [Anoplophora glabripennis]
MCNINRIATELDAVLVALLEDEINLNAIDNAVEAVMPPLVIIPPMNETHRNPGYYEFIIPTYNVDYFHDHFRMTRGIFELLLNKLKEALPNENYGVVEYEKKLLFTIWILAKQESFLSAGDRFNLAKSTGHQIFFKVVQHIADLREEIIKWPNRQQRLEICRRFQEKSGIPGIVGAIDGCHISIKGPPGNAIDYYNRNNYNSIILQATCNDKKEFIDIYVGAPGRLHCYLETIPRYQKMSTY